MSEKINIILRQTDYTEETARTKLSECGDDHMKVIRAYLGIAEKKAPDRVKSVNQEIYKQIRVKLRDVNTEIPK
jgi:hypothetical protein